MSTDKTFGGFFRSKRKRLSPTLREFCRRNGFDAGNISRLERGLVSPPQTRQLLESYAKALKLEEGTAEWDRFFELAAAETGRIPADVMDNQQRAQKLPRLFRQLRVGVQGQSGWVRARHLESWADTLDATGGSPRAVPPLDSGDRQGYQTDRVSGRRADATAWVGRHRRGGRAGDVYVPEGTSVWEMGVDKDSRKKLEGDFSKRTKSRSVSIPRKPRSSS